MITVHKFYFLSKGWLFLRFWSFLVKILKCLSHFILINLGNYLYLGFSVGRRMGIYTWLWSGLTSHSVALNHFGWCVGNHMGSQNQVVIRMYLITVLTQQTLDLHFENQSLEKNLKHHFSSFRSLEDKKLSGLKISFVKRQIQLFNQFLFYIFTFWIWLVEYFLDGFLGIFIHFDY